MLKYILVLLPSFKFRQWHLLLLLGLVCARLAQAQEPINQPAKDTFLFVPDTSYLADSLVSDSMFYAYRSVKKITLLDSLANDTFLKMIFKPYLFIQNRYVGKMKIRRDLPTAKEISYRTVNNNRWKFWVIIFVLTYIAVVRIINPNNFTTFIYSVFNLKLSEKIWEDQRSAFRFIFLQLFAIYIFIAAIFITYQLELRNVLLVHNYFIQFLLVVALLLGVYVVKFLLHAFLGMLLNMRKLAVGFVSNTVSVNNFIALVIFPLTIFMIYNFDPLWSTVISQSIIALFFISVLYRVVRIFMLGSSFFSFPGIYLILYLCALEILPWFIIIKYLNTTRL